MARRLGPSTDARPAELRRLKKTPGLNHLTVVDEPNDECCAIEAWPLTLARIIATLNPDGLRTAGILI